VLIAGNEYGKRLSSVDRDDNALFYLGLMVEGSFEICGKDL